MKFRGREIDPIALWSSYVDFPHNMVVDGKFLPLVRCPNPQHDTLKRHFQINVVDGLVHCFAQCGISGTYTHAISMIEGCDERRAKKLIFGHRTRNSQGNGKREKIEARPASRPTSIVSNDYTKYLPSIALEYLSGRGIVSGSIATWDLRWDEDEKRIVIPAKDLRGITRFFIKRAVLESQHPKYLYGPEGVSKNSLLFGACQTDPGVIRSDGLILVEGSLDAIRLAQHGYRNVVACLGTGISEIQCRIVSRMRPRRIVAFFDKDTAGLHGVEIAARRLGKYPIAVVRYPAGKSDPAELNRREAETAIERAIPLSRFMARVGQLART
jgi:DNA primase